MSTADENYRNVCEQVTSSLTESASRLASMVCQSMLEQGIAQETANEMTNQVLMAATNNLLCMVVESAEFIDPITGSVHLSANIANLILSTRCEYLVSSGTLTLEEAEKLIEPMKVKPEQVAEMCAEAVKAHAEHEEAVAKAEQATHVPILDKFGNPIHESN